MFLQIIRTSFYLFFSYFHRFDIKKIHKLPSPGPAYSAMLPTSA